MKVTVTLEFDVDNNAEYVGKHSGSVDVGVLLRDALGEFQAARKPAAKYVDKRYPRTDGWLSSTGRLFKIRDVEKRVAMAQMLARADVTILVDE
jgi:hypothetical protein